MGPTGRTTSMPFDYLHSDVPRAFGHAPEKAEAQYRKELEERAGLLHRLHYGRLEAVRRLMGNLAWDWEVNRSPAFVARLRASVEQVVDRVYSRPRPPDKGRRVTAAELKVAPSD